MKFLRKLLMTLTGFLLGALAGVFVAGGYVRLTYSCQPGPLEPCDAGGYVGMGLAMVLSPVLGLLFGFIAYKLAARINRKRAA